MDQGLLDTPVLYLSRYIFKNKAKYYSKLLGVTIHNAWIDWILYLLEAVTETARWTTTKIISIQNLIFDTCIFIQNQAPAIYNKDLVETLFVQPYVRIENLVNQKLMSRFTASKHLKILCEIGVLEEMKAGREKLFINKKFLNLLKEK